MTAPHDADRLVHAFLQDGPAELSPPLIERIRDEVHDTKQRTVRRPWRTPSMPRQILLVASLTAVVVAIGAMLFAGSGGPSPVVTPAPSASARATASSSVAPSPSTTPGPSPYPLAAGEAWIVLGGADRATLIRPDGTGQHEILTELGVSIGNPAWSPDGRQLVFEANGDRGSQLWVADADGTGAHALAPTPPGCPEGQCTEGVQPAWSPDGRTIAYIAPQHDLGTFTRTALMLVDVATGATTEVYGTSDATLSRPTWSPDSRSIAIDIGRFEGAVEATRLVSTVIGVVDLDATDRTPREITDPALLAGYPTWHPTDSVIVFRTNLLDTNTQTLLDDGAPSNIYTIRPDGTKLTKVTDFAARGDIVRAPSWTPDGRILFSKLADPASEEVLRTIDPDGTNEASATGDTITTGEGRWRPGT